VIVEEVVQFLRNENKTKGNGKILNG